MTHWLDLTQTWPNAAFLNSYFRCLCLPNYFVTERKKETPERSAKFLLRNKSRNKEMDPYCYDCWLPASSKARMSDMCRRVISIALALCTHFLPTQTAILTLNIDAFPSQSVILLVCLEPPVWLLTDIRSFSTWNIKPLIQHQQRWYWDFFFLH